MVRFIDGTRRIGRARGENKSLITQLISTLIRISFTSVRVGFENGTKVGLRTFREVCFGITVGYGTSLRRECLEVNIECLG